MGPILKLYLIIRRRKINNDDFYKLNIYYNSLPAFKNIKIVFSAYFFSPLTLGANSQFKNKIYVSSEWAVLLLENDNEEIKNAFLFTLGHELTHKDKSFPTNKYRKKDLKFINWVNEVYCDFGAAKKIGNNSKDNLKRAIKFKIKMKPHNEESKTHPSWNKRLEYAEIGVFGKILIKQIYTDSKCNNDDLLNEVIEFYKNRTITLK